MHAPSFIAHTLWLLYLPLSFFTVAAQPAPTPTAPGHNDPAFVKSAYRHAYEKWMYYLMYIEDQNLPEDQRTIGVKCAKVDGAGNCINLGADKESYIHCKGTVANPTWRAGACTFMEFVEHITGNSYDANGNYAGPKTKFPGVKVYARTSGGDDILIDEVRTIHFWYNNKQKQNGKMGIPEGSTLKREVWISHLEFLPEPWTIVKDGKSKWVDGKKQAGHVLNVYDSAEVVGISRATLDSVKQSQQQKLQGETNYSFERSRVLRECDGWKSLKSAVVTAATREKWNGFVLTEKSRIPFTMEPSFDYTNSVQGVPTQKEKDAILAAFDHISKQGKAGQHYKLNEAYWSSRGRLLNVCSVPAGTIT